MSRGFENLSIKKAEDKSPLSFYILFHVRLLNKIKTGKISAIRFSTLEAICDVLDCQPGDILEFRRDE